MARRHPSLFMLHKRPFLVEGLLIATLAAIFALGIGEYLLDSTAHSIRDLHVFLLFILVVCLALAGLSSDYLAKRRLLDEARIFHEHLRASLVAGKSVSWDLDLGSGRDDWFGDLETMFGIPAQSHSIQVGDFYKFVHPDDRQRVSDAVAQARENHAPYASEFRVIRRDGATRWVQANGEFIFRKNGQPDRMLGVAVDVTDRKRIEEALKKSEEKFSKAFRETPAVLTLTSTSDHRYVDVNEAFERITGWKREEVIGRTPFDLQLWVEPSARTQLVERLLAGDVVRGFEVHYRCKDGRLGVGLGSAELMEIDGEKLMLSAIIGITERKRAEEALAKSEDKFSKIFKNNPGIAVLASPDGRYLDVNDTFERLSGWKRDEVVGRNAEEVGLWINPADRQIFVEQVLKEGFVRDVEVRTRWRDGQERVGLISAGLIELDGKPTILSSLIDITERKKTEEALVRSEEKFAKAFRCSATVFTLSTLKEDTYLDVNLAFEQATGYTREEVIGHKVSDLQIWENYAEREKLAEKIVGGEPIRNVECRFRKKTGEIFVGLLSAELVDLDGETCVFGSVIDITDRKRAQEALAESEEKFSKAFRQSPIIMMISDLPDGCFLEVNHTFEEVTGWTRDDVIGRKAKDFGIWRDPSARTPYLEKVVKHGPLKNIETRFTCKDGTERYGLASSEVIELAGKPAVLSAIIDITDRKRAQEALSQSEEKFSKAFRQSPTPITITSVEDGRFLEVNQALEEMTGYTRNELLGHTALEFGIWRDAGERESFIKETLAKGSVRNFETSFIGKDAIERLGLASSEMIEFDGKPAILTAIVDITERKRAEQALWKKQQELAEAQRIAQIGSWEFDLASMTYIWSEELFRLHGLDPNLPPPKPEDSEHLFTPESWQRLCESMTRAIQDGIVPEMDLEAVRPDGRHRWLAVRGQVMRNADGLVLAVRGTAQDVTERKQAELARLETEDKFRRVVEHIGDAVFADDLDGKVLFANDNFLRLFGIRREDLDHITMENHIAPEFRALLVDRRQRRLNGEVVPSQYEYEGLRIDGTRVWLEVNVVLIRDSAGKITGTQSAMRDITARKRAESILRESEEKYRRLVEHIPDALIVDDASGNIVYANDRLLELFGYTRDQLKTLTTWDLIAPERRSELRARHEARMRGESIISHYEFEAVRADGTRLWVDGDVTVIRNDNGNIVGSQKILRDISDRKRSEEALLDRENRLRLAMQAGKMFAFDWTPETDIVVRSSEYVDVLGNGHREQTTLSRILETIYPEDREEFAHALKSVTPADPSSKTTFRLSRPDGRLVWLERTLRGHFDEAGKLQRVAGVVADITERKQAEQVIRQTSDRLQMLVEHIGEALVVDDSSGRVTYANDQFLTMFRIPRGQLSTTSLGNYIAPEFRDRILRKHQEPESMVAPLHCNFEGLRRDGTSLWVSADIVPIRDVKGQFIGTQKLLRDQTQEKLAQDVLRESEERFRLVANTAPVMIWMADPDKLYTYFNKPWLDFTGRSLPEELGSGWEQGVHQEDQENWLTTFNEAFDARQPFRTRYRLRRYDGEYRWILDIGVPRFNGDGSFAGYIGSCLDITERKLAEEALASVGRRLIEAHEEERTRIGRELHDDVNQRLALMAVELDRATKVLGAGEDVGKAIERVQKRIFELSKDVQGLSHRLHSSKLDYLGLASAANSFCRELAEQNNVDIRFTHFGIPRDLPKDISLCFFRVLQEALQNAVKHSGVAQFTVELSGADGIVELTIVDNGVGFNEEEVLAHKGLGLISMRERLQMVSGHFSVTSKPGTGTVVRARVHLPADRSQAMAS